MHQPIWTRPIHDLSSVFEDLNRLFFDGFLDEPYVGFNERLRTSAGRFIPGRRTWLDDYPAKIEIASYLMSEPNGFELIRDTMGHEMIHYWLWVRRKPYGHTAEFYEKMRQMGVSRYNPVPKNRPFKWLYHCSNCLRDFPARRRLSRVLACAQCCGRYSGGKFDRRFVLTMVGPYRPSGEWTA